jgi:hypothetical protein
VIGLTIHSTFYGVRHFHPDVVFYQDGERFARIYNDRKKAAGFADRQKKSPVVKRARVTEIR